jgi:3-oxoacyl-[acyl-carrier protein] reductase
MEINLQSKRALVCGSTQGIGKSIAIDLAEAGAEIILFARNEEALKKTLAELPNNYQQKHKYIAADFSHPEKVGEAIKTFISKNNSIQIIINNTGGPTAGQAIDADIQDFRIAFNQHLINNQLILQALLPGMKESGYGRIINIISTSVKVPIQGLGVSNTIRGAVASWAKTISNELGPFGITVNNILPGLTKTKRLESLIEKRANDAGKSIIQMEELMKATIPLRRFADANEISSLACFLASPYASYITGTSIRVDGGSTPSI